MIEQSWSAMALTPPRAHGDPLVRGRLRVEPEDFLVEEELGFEASGSGQHALLKVRKRNANTEWVARELAREAGCRPHDVGFAGLKDRHAVAVQWFTVPLGRAGLERWPTVSATGYEVLEAHAHSRKLPRGALAGNRFAIRIREARFDEVQLHRRLEEIERRGVPNYFGPQRFGRDGGNLERIGAAISTLRPAERGHVLSAARSLIFNAVLAERVRDGSWEQLLDGDIANLDGRGSVFAVPAVDEGLLERCARLEIHPTGPLWGRGEPASQGSVRALEERIAQTMQAACGMTVSAGMEQERRSLRLAVRDLSWEQDAGALQVNFRLPRGCFATTVLSEFADVDAT